MEAFEESDLILLVPNIPHRWKRRYSYSRITKIFQYVKENYSEKVKLTKMASLLNINEGAFLIFFCRVLNKYFLSF